VGSSLVILIEFLRFSTLNTFLKNKFNKTKNNIICAQSHPNITKIYELLNWSFISYLIVYTKFPWSTWRDYSYEFRKLHLMALGLSKSKWCAHFILGMTSMFYRCIGYVYQNGRTNFFPCIWVAPFRYGNWKQIQFPQDLQQKVLNHNKIGNE